MESTEKKGTKAVKAFWHGIKAVFTAIVDWVATLFGMKDNSMYGRVLHRVVAFGMDTVIPLVAASIFVGDTANDVTFADHTQSQYNLQGKLLVANQIRGQITPPAYSSIEAIDNDLYLCKTDYGRGIILNSKGQRVE